MTRLGAGVAAAAWTLWACGSTQSDFKDFKDTAPVPSAGSDSRGGAEPVPAGGQSLGGAASSGGTALAGTSGQPAQAGQANLGGSDFAAGAGGQSPSTAGAGGQPEAPSCEDLHGTCTQCFIPSSFEGDTVLLPDPRATCPNAQSTGASCCVQCEITASSPRACCLDAGGARFRPGCSPSGRVECIIGSPCSPS